MGANSLTAQSGTRPGSHQDQAWRVRPLQEVHPARARSKGQSAPTGDLVKRVFDCTAALAGLVALAPALLVIAVLVRLETPGPALFRQRRGGHDGRTFLVLKFRTMRVMDDGRTVVQAHDGDPRVTRLGAFLRRTSLDELPQLVNVLRGEMSLVGPRPHAVTHDAQFMQIAPQYAERHRARPGITGLAQVSGCRGETKSDESVRARIRYDLEYISRWSLGLDILILLKTLLPAR
jgi:putative colanic acid biosynthesis UDP-glucose lipid carrier transferase